MTETKTAVFPETLCRVTFNSYFVDEQGYLLSHEINEEIKIYTPQYSIKHEICVLDGVKKMWLPGGQMREEYRVLPLVHPDEWETIARYFAHRFRLLTIDASKVEDLTHELLLQGDGLCHEALVHGEYFGKVPLTAIVKDEEYSWEKSDKPLNLSEDALDFLRKKGKLELTEEFHPVLL
ncbi:MAG: hypothetical protein KAT77_00275 [Nanoarchaeota archaeon]|nr:hypothetical protein [Nanoarchaeota archaeon]